MTVQEAYKYIGMSEKDFPILDAKILEEVVKTATEPQKRHSKDPHEKKTAEAWIIFRDEYNKWRSV